MSTGQNDQSGFELAELLGEGLNSQVYRATRTTLGAQTIAVKIPKTETAVALLRREFETLEKVHSAHCVRSIDFILFRETPTLLLEFIDGVTLMELAQQSLTLEEQNEIVRQIHAGLSDLHAADLVHGDLHPNNVMIDRNGHVKLIDFAAGLAVDGERQAAPAFASPDIWAGGDPSPSSDLFALQIIRDLMSRGYRCLPERSFESAPLTIAEKNPRAKLSIARRLSHSHGVGTQVLEIDSSSKPTSVHQRQLIGATRIAAGFVALAMILGPAMSSEAPENDANAAASIRIASQNWMHIRLNGKDAGYAPLEVQKIKAGHHRLVWETALTRGELSFDLVPGQVASLQENRGHLEVR